LPKTSFRLHLAMNTLVVGWTLPAVRARWGLAPVRIRSCWANHKKGCRNQIRHPFISIDDILSA
ncbi:MAG: hypothetical protein PHY27_13395, partial [Parabacteroides sp.]|nr:hypothetical protein [Parabacteroides sp.]